MSQEERAHQRELMQRVNSPGPQVEHPLTVGEEDLDEPMSLEEMVGIS